MTQEFNCVADGCDFTAQGDSEDEVIEEVEEHRQEHHPDMDVSESDIRDNIQTV